MKHSISIVIPSYLRHDKLYQCVQSIIAYTDLEQCEIVVVCNGAVPEAKQICTSSRLERIAEYEAELLTIDSIRPEDRYEWEHRLTHALAALRERDTELPISLLWFPEAIGYPRACNDGIRANDDEFVILLNDDCLLLSQPKNEWVDVLLRPFLHDGAVGITGPQRLWDENSEHFFLIFFCVMLRRTCLNEIGLLDECTGLGFGEDTIASIEAERKGWKVLQVPDDNHTNTLADIDPNTTTLETWKHDKIWCGNFRLFHDSESTLGRIPESDAILNKNRAMLRERYRPQVANDPNTCSRCHGPAENSICIGGEQGNCDGLVLWRAHAIDGWFNIDEGAWLAKQVKSLPPNSRVIEIGSWHGRSSRFIADNLSEGSKVVCCDTWNGSSGEPDAHLSAAQREGDHAYSWWYCNLHEHVTAGRVTPLRIHSANGAETLGHIIDKGEAEKFDLIFIDGDHSDIGIKTDVEAWLPLLKEGGLLCGHDYYKENEGPYWVHVRQYVEDKFPRVEKAATSIWHVRPTGYATQFGDPEYDKVVETEHQTLITKWFADIPKDAKILDAGCGDGVATKILRQRGFTNVVPFDQTFSEIDGLVLGDLHDLPEAANSVDVIYSVHSLEHAHDPIKVLSEFKRVLKPDGQLFLILPYPDYIYDEHRANVHCGSVPLGLNVVDNAETLLRNLGSAGFAQVSVEGGSLRNESEIYLQLKQEQIERPYIYDCFLFHNELSVLEIRLATLYDVVDRFVLVEATHTHAGEPKPLYFDENKERFAKYLHKIDHIIIDFPEFEGNVYDKAWGRERYQRDMCMKALGNCKDNDIIIIGDADEIASPEAIAAFKVSADPIVRLKQRMFYYYLNCENKEGWDWQKLARYAEVKRLTPCGIRYPPAGDLPLVKNGGFHFSFCGNAEHISQKLSDYSHREFDTPEINNLETIKRKVVAGEDIFGRDLQYEFVGIDDSYPLYIRENLARFTPLLWDVCEPASNVIEFKRPLTVTAEVSTKDRYQTTLPLALSAIINQTRKPEKLKVYDDGEQVNLFDVAPFNGLLRLAQDKGIEVEVLSTPRKGQVTNHQHCLENATTDIVFRIDDDEVAEPDCLANLLAEMRDGVGAVAGLIHHPANVSPLPDNLTPTLVDIDRGNIQWHSWNGGPKEAEHLYSSFIYRVSAAKEAGGYPMELSPVGHREESIFSARIHRAGYKLIITPHAKTIHLRESTGGIRSYTDTSMWQHDEGVFQAYLKAWDLPVTDTKLVILDCGLGDALCFRGVFLELQRRNPRKWTLAVCQREVFNDLENVTIISIAEAKLLVGSRYDQYSLYRWCWDRGWNKSIVDAMYEFYA